MQVLLTGANGFVGRAVSRALLTAGHQVAGIVRQAGQCEPGVREWVLPSADFADLENASPTLRRTDCVIHLAARVHIMGSQSASALALYRATNLAGTMRVAKAAAAAGVRRFVFLSTIKALGESEPGRPWRESDTPCPTDPYGISKLEAEQALGDCGRQSAMEIVILRPPLVYGPEVRANFLQLMRLVARGWPLPLGAINTRRSLLYVANLADALLLCAAHPAAANEVFHVADLDDLSVGELALILGRQLHRPSRLLSVPPSILRLLGKLSGRSEQIDRLIMPLRLDTAHIRDKLGWRAPYSIEHGLLETANWYRATLSSS